MPLRDKILRLQDARSLDAFCKKFSSRIGDKYLVYTKDYGKDNDTILLPVYMVPFL